MDGTDAADGSSESAPRREDDSRISPVTDLDPDVFEDATHSLEDPGPVPAGIYRVTNVGSGKVLDVAGAEERDGANVHQWGWHGGDNQRWRLRPLGDGVYRLVNLHSRKVLDVAKRSQERSASIHQWSFHGGQSQRWEIRDLGGGHYGLVNGNSGHALDVERNSMKDGGDIHQWPWHGGANQRWRLARL